MEIRTAAQRIEELEAEVSAASAQIMSDNKIWTERQLALLNERDRARTEAECLASTMADVFMWHCRVQDPDWKVTTADECHCDICEPARAAIAAHRAAMTEPQTCTWTYDSDCDVWNTACGKAWVFTGGGPVENECRYCHGCGKPIVVADAQP
jgi:hypothetical protein